MNVYLVFVLDVLDRLAINEGRVLTSIVCFPMFMLPMFMLNPPRFLTKLNIF